ncbi:MAG: hypothetical protein WBO06_09575 [Gammaproteobacteria bacterium]
MAARTLTLQCDIATSHILSRAIRDYALAAYPEGGSECAQVARYTLLELAATIDAGVTTDTAVIEISKRPRAMVKAAIEYYFDRMDAAQGGISTEQRRVFLALLSGAPVNRALLAAAAVIDRAG